MSFLYIDLLVRERPCGVGASCTKHAFLIVAGGEHFDLIEAWERVFRIYILTPDFFTGL